MTEAEWLASTDPLTMLKHLGEGADKRKLRLFGCACARQIWPRLDEAGKRAVEVGERFADGRADGQELSAAAEAVAERTGAARGVARRYASYTAGRVVTPDVEAAASACWAAATATWLAAAATRVAARTAARIDELTTQAHLLRCVFGNPFRTVSLDPPWLTWHDGTIPKLAQAIYDERAFDRLPILADALEEAGCTDPEILSRCRGSGPHVRGCWVVDLLLGKA
jgi:hypothetical protein